MTAYLDTSFLVSLYTPDANSGKAAQQMREHEGTISLLSDLAEIEFVNALQQRIFRKELTTAKVGASYKAFQEDFDGGVFQKKIVEMGTIYLRCQRLSRKWTARLGVRTLDILHVAYALELGASLLLTFDQQQAKLALAEELKVG